MREATTEELLERIADLEQEIVWRKEAQASIGAVNFDLRDENAELKDWLAALEKANREQYDLIIIHKELLHDLDAILKTALHNGHHDLIQRVSEVCKDDKEN
jgi:cell division protein FtsB